MGTLRMLEAVRTADWPIRFYQAGSSEMYGKVVETPQSETTPFNPRSPYAIAKVFAHFMTVDYREAYGLHASNGILFNHESPRRGGTFVTRKVTRGVAAILTGKQEHLFLGNLDAQRDWGYAKEYVEAMWLMLQQPEPGDYVIATGEMHSVRELCEVAFRLVIWTGSACARRRALLPADGGGGAPRGRVEGQAVAGLGSADEVPGPRATDAGARPRGRRGRCATAASAPRMNVRSLGVRLAERLPSGVAARLRSESGITAAFALRESAASCRSAGRRGQVRPMQRGSVLRSFRARRSTTGSGHTNPRF